MKYYKIIRTIDPPHSYYGANFQMGVMSTSDESTFEDALAEAKKSAISEKNVSIEEITEEEFTRYWEFVL